MTIEFKCPHCKSLCAFMDKYAGRRAKCLSCQKRFFIPKAQGLKAFKIPEPKEGPLIPRPGFYKAMFLYTWIIFSRKNSLKMLVFLMFLIYLKFFVGKFALYLVLISPKVFSAPNPFAWLSHAIIMIASCLLYAGIWGLIFDFYMCTIFDNALEYDRISDPLEDKELPFWQHMLKPFCVFGLTVYTAFLPLMLIFMIGIEVSREVFYSLAAIGFLIFPCMLVSISIIKDMSAFRPKNIFRPVFRRFFPYIMLPVMFAGVIYCELNTNVIGSISHGQTNTTTKMMLLNMALQIPVLWAMRTAGLFYKHYSCYFTM
jgi:hypothetical protein